MIVTDFTGQYIEDGLDLVFADLSGGIGNTTKRLFAHPWVPVRDSLA